MEPWDIPRSSGDDVPICRYICKSFLSNSTLLLRKYTRGTTFAHMHKKRLHNPYRHMSSKRAAAVGAWELTVLLLDLLANNREIPSDLFNSKRKRARKIREIRKRGYITEKNSLTKKGQYLLSEDKIWSLAIPHPAHWDEKWRIVLFDIPINKSKQRHAFRMHLKELGLVLYQKSVWIYPYPLEETILMISDFYKISDCVLFVVAENVNKEDVLLKHFGLQK